MHGSANTSSRSQLTGTAKGFMAARRRRRQELTVAPQMRWARFAAGPTGTSTPTLQLDNAGGPAADTSVVLFTNAAVVREAAGDAGVVENGERWDLTVDELVAGATEPLRGYVLARGGDGRWFASTVDGRSATFRSMPDELGVMRTLGLRLPLSAEALDGELRCERSAG